MRPRRVRQRARRDDNHEDIVDAFLKFGASVLELYQLPGALDLLIGVEGIDQRVEVKDGAKPRSRQTLTKDEVDVILHWRGRKPEIVRTPDEARAIVSRLRAESRTIVAQQLRRPPT